jgi:hypothetical protein
MPLAGSDCELPGSGWLVQAVNAWSSTAYLLAAVCLLRARRRSTPPASPVVLVGAVALALVAIGSFLFHGPQPSWAEAAHDGSIAALLVVFLFLDARGPHAVSRILAACTVAAVLVLATSSDVVVHGLLGVAVFVVELRRRRHMPVPASAVLLFGVAVVLLAFGRTGGALCAPRSVVQAHAGWHVLSAAAAWIALMPRDARGSSRGTVVLG